MYSGTDQTHFFLIYNKNCPQIYSVKFASELHENSKYSSKLSSIKFLLFSPFFHIKCFLLLQVILCSPIFLLIDKYSIDSCLIQVPLYAGFTVFRITFSKHF